MGFEKDLLGKKCLKTTQLLRSDNMTSEIRVDFGHSNYEFTLESEVFDSSDDSDGTTQYGQQTLLKLSLLIENL